VVYVGVCGLIIGSAVDEWFTNPGNWVVLATSLPLTFFVWLTIKRMQRRIRARAEQAVFTAKIAAYTQMMNTFNSKGRSQ
jgi:uncharacterized membrane protein